jgi:glycosyltransferase involved in cell wall biosynthesis
LAPRQLDLPLYRLFGKKVVMEYLGNDIQGYELSIRKYRWTNMSHILSPAEGKKYDEKIRTRVKNEIKYIDRTLVCAPVYAEFAPHAEVLSLAIDIEAIPFSPMPAFNGTFKIMHAPTSRGFKGTKYIVEAVDQLRAEGLSIEFDLVEGVPHDELLNRYRACHIFIDQILGGWYGTASIEAMAIGRPVVVSIREDYFQHIDFGNQIPAIHADPDCIVQVLRELLNRSYGDLTKRGVESRKFVEEFHSVKKVTDKLVSIYESLL